jgi:uncharacterized protein with ATP-grasp and redox domains
MYKGCIINVKICPESAFDLTLDEADGASSFAVLSQIETEGQAIHLLLVARCNFIASPLTLHRAARA